MRKRNAVIALFLLTACAPPPTDRLQFVALGTLVDINVSDAPAGWDSALAASLEPWLTRWGRDMYAYGDGELARANAVWASGGCVALSSELATLVSTARELEARHGDRFVPALAGVTRLWRLHETHSTHWRPPADARLGAALAGRPSTRHLVAQGKLTCARGPVQLDTGGFAKGYALDRLVDTLTGLGVPAALVGVGGDLSALGQGAAGPWRAGIKAPAGDGAIAVVTVEHGESIMTSGDYARAFEWNGERYAHILDPASGRPVKGIASVTVVGRDATRADAAATALAVAAGRARATGDWPQLPAVADADTYLVLASDGSAVISAPMAARLTWLARPERLHNAL